MSEPRSLVVVGGGEHACVVVDAALSRPDLWNVRGYTDVMPNERVARRFGVAYLGTDEQALRAAPDACFILGFGANGVSLARTHASAHLSRSGARFACVVHAAACVSSTASLEPGVVVMAGAIVNTGAIVGVHSVVNSGAIVEHDVVLGAHCLVGPGAVVGGGASIGAGSYVGLGSRVRDHVRIGRSVLVGMGAVVVRDADDDVVLVGVPARPKAKAR